jgi:outer membrane biosynthesis protein TonB
MITRASGGLTRRINILSDKALLAAFTENTHAVADKQVRAAIADSEFAAVSKPKRPLAYIGAALAAGVIAGALIQWTMFSAAPPGAAPAAKAPPPPAPVPIAKVEPLVPIPAVPAPAVAAPAVPDPAVPIPVVPVPPAASAPVEVPVAETKKQPEAKPEQQPAAQPGAQLRKDQQRRFAAYSPGGQKLLGGRLAATRQLLESAPGERYALELFMTDNLDPARMERFLQRARELVPLSEVFVMPSSYGGSNRLRVLFGDFSSREEALAAGRRLPPRYQQAFKAIPRSVAELRSQI